MTAVAAPPRPLRLRPPGRRCLLASAALALSFAAALPPRAADAGTPPPATHEASAAVAPADVPTEPVDAPAVTFRVQVILANNIDDFCDERVRPIRERLRDLFDYTHYVQLQIHSADAAMGARARFHLPGGRFLRLQPRGLDKVGRLRMMVELEDVFQTEFRLSSGGTLVVGGPKTPQGVLIFAIHADLTATRTTAIAAPPAPPPVEE